METFPALLALCAGNSPVTGEFPTQRPVTRSFDVFSDLRLNKRLSKQWWGWWFETLLRPLWRHRNVMHENATEAVKLTHNKVRQTCVQGLYSLSGKTSYRKISWSLEAARFGFKLFQSLWNLAVTSAALLPRYLSNFRAIRLLQYPILRLRDFTRFGGKTSYRLVNRGPGLRFQLPWFLIFPSRDMRTPFKWRMRSWDFLLHCEC